MFNLKRRLRSWWLHLYTRLFLQYDVLDNQPWHSNLKSYFHGLKDPIFRTDSAQPFFQVMFSWGQELQNMALPLHNYQPQHTNAYAQTPDFFMEHELRRRQIQLYAQAAQLCIQLVKDLLHARSHGLDSHTYQRALDQLNAPQSQLSGQTVLGFFSGTHLTTLIQILLHLGANPLAQDQFGKTALEIANLKTQQLQSGAGLAQHQAQQALLVQSLLFEHQLQQILPPKASHNHGPQRL